jgi:hypothetical protein
MHPEHGYVTEYVFKDPDEDYQIKTMLIKSPVDVFYNKLKDFFALQNTP